MKFWRGKGRKKKKSTLECLMSADCGHSWGTDEAWAMY